jgi:hypothetical protein
MSCRAWWVVLLALALLLRGVTAVHAHPVSAPQAPAAALATGAQGCHAQAPDDALRDAERMAERWAERLAAGDGQHASPPCQIACDLQATAALLAPAGGDAVRPVAVQVAVVPRLHAQDAPPPDRPPPIC